MTSCLMSVTSCYSVQSIKFRGELKPKNRSFLAAGAFFGANYYIFGCWLTVPPSTAY